MEGWVGEGERVGLAEAGLEGQEGWVGKSERVALGKVGLEGWEGERVGSAEARRLGDRWRDCVDGSEMLKEEVNESFDFF